MSAAGQAQPVTIPPQQPLLICFSHLRWNFVFQRPQQLMTRFSAQMTVVFWEEPLVEGEDQPTLSVRQEGDVIVVVPRLPAGLDAEATHAALARLLTAFLVGKPSVAVRWYYTPMMLAFSRQLRARCTVYDCMDELSAFRFAPPTLLDLEGELLGAADVVFTGGYSLYEAKRGRHADVRPFPSSVDVAHFARARDLAPSRRDTPILGFYGVIDERMDLELVTRLADERPQWRIELVGPVVKIDPADLPQRSNLHYLGARSYDDLPDAVARWDVALMPFAINDATRFISPTKTPEYLAAGRPVVSTPIVDVARHYGTMAGVIIASGSRFVSACDDALTLARSSDLAWRDEADAVLAATSWDDTAAAMLAAIAEVSSGPERPHYDVLVVGAGFAGSVMAERFAADAGKRVLIIDRRPHIAGNAYDEKDAAGILIHRYGPHIFHTNAADIFAYLSRFTQWRPYEHRVLAEVRGRQVPIPINRTTLNMLFDAGLKDDEDAAAFLAARAAGRRYSHFEGRRRLCGRRRTVSPVLPRLHAQAMGSQPVRTGQGGHRPGSDTHQHGRPVFRRRLPGHARRWLYRHVRADARSPAHDVRLGTDFTSVRETIDYDLLVFAGPIDEYFDYRYGALPYRSLRFDHRTLPVERHQQVAVVNYPDEAVPYTRVTEYKHLTGQTARVSSVTYEYPAEEGDPYYPIPRPENQALFKRYELLALAEPDVLFVGRLAIYRYYNMDQVVGQALATYRKYRKREDAAALATAAE